MQIRQVRIKDCSEPKLNGKLGRSEAKKKTWDHGLSMSQSNSFPWWLNVWKFCFVDCTELDIYSTVLNSMALVEM